MPAISLHSPELQNCLQSGYWNHGLEVLKLLENPIVCSAWMSAAETNEPLLSPLSSILGKQLHSVWLGHRGQNGMILSGGL